MKLLVIHQGALGDFIMTFPAMIALRRTYVKIDALCQQKLGQLARELNLIEKYYTLESAAVAPLYGDHPDRVDVATTALLRSYERIVLFSFSSGIQENIERITGPNVLRIPPRPPVGEKIHVSRFLWERLNRAGLLESVASYLPSDFMPLLPQPHGINPDSASVLIHPGSGSRKKNWPLKHFIQLEGMLRKDDRRVEWILGPADTHLYSGLERGQSPRPTVHIVDDLLQALSLLKGACGFIGNDSGLAHLAAVVGIPTTVVFGPSDPVRWKPLGPSVAVIYTDLECSPCHEDNSRRCDFLKCFEEISPQRVYGAFCRLIQAAASGINWA